jgi:hypothetical protein
MMMRRVVAEVKVKPWVPPICLREQDAVDTASATSTTAMRAT